MDEAVQAQRVVVMHQGNVLMDGTPREIFTPGGHAARRLPDRAADHRGAV